MIKPTLALTAASLLAFGQASTFAATGNVTLSGSTWTGAVDGVTKYTGTSMAAAANACATAMTSGGTINVKNSGAVNGSIRIYANTTVDGYGCTLTGNGTGGIVHAQNVSTVGGKNINMAGTDWFGMYFCTCSGQNFSGVNGTSGIAYRIDDCKGGAGYNFSCGSVNLTGGGDNGVETYGISGNSWSTVTVSDRTVGCGLLLNYSSSAAGTTVNATRCNYGGGYAGFRTANNNRSSTLTYDNATSCGRGYFSVTGSDGATLTRVNATSCSGIGIWLQSTSNTHVNGGTIKNCAGGCSSISSDLGGNSITVSCQ